MSDDAQEQKQAMGEWRVGTGCDFRLYDPGVLAVAYHEFGWSVCHGDSYVALGAECLPFSRDLCDEAAVAYALLLLAKRLAAYGERIDAALAREYRQARTAYLACCTAGDPDGCPRCADLDETIEARAEHRDALSALMRGHR